MQICRDDAIAIAVNGLRAMNAHVDRFSRDDLEYGGRAAFSSSVAIFSALMLAVFGNPDGPDENGVLTASPKDRTVERLQKWFATHGHPEWAIDPQPLEQLASIVIDEYEKRRNSGGKVSYYPNGRRVPEIRLR